MDYQINFSKLIIKHNIDYLKKITSDNPKQKKLIDTIEKLCIEKFKIVDYGLNNNSSLVVIDSIIFKDMFIYMSIYMSIYISIVKFYCKFIYKK